eukprot:5438944-Amphidinium_carterae.2
MEPSLAESVWLTTIAGNAISEPAAFPPQGLLVGGALAPELHTDMLTGRGRMFDDAGLIMLDAGFLKEFGPVWVASGLH